MISLKKLILPLMALPFISACSQDFRDGIVFEKEGYHFPYQLNKPGQSWKMPVSLTEISGISCIDEARLACVQDEEGIIYIFNTNDEKIEKEIIFSDHGDYEDIVIVGRDAWILKSNGTLFELPDFMNNPGRTAKKYPTELTDVNDAEGLAFDPESNSLLIACKEEPYMDGSVVKKQKAVYKFNLETKTLGNKPWQLIRTDSLQFTGAFKPSGIAVHPQTGELYLLSSAGKALLVMTKQGQILAQVKLSPALFPQPEGICFSPEGTLYISSEGDGREGRIFRFAPAKI